MPRKPSAMFTDKELEIMRVIWDLGEATVKDIQDRLTGDQHYNSVLTISQHAISNASLPSFDADGEIERDPAWIK